METLKFETEIKSTPENIWKILWDKETYSDWTQYFAKDSEFKTDWKVGGETFFLDPKGDGMFSTIESLNEPFEVVFSHLGLVKDRVALTKTKDVEEWSGMLEKYFLAERDGFTNLKVIVHSPNEHHDFMTTAFTRGLEKVKTLAEQV
jgi:hypothetical protein